MIMHEHNIQFYTDHAAQQDALYNTVRFCDVHQAWLPLLATLPPGAAVLDVGAGNGRDILALHEEGLKTFAVEPSPGLRNIGKQRSPHTHWIDDTLPALTSTKALQQSFDLILLSGVWMHLPKHALGQALESLLMLLRKKGTLVITLRHGDFKDARTTHHPDIAALRAMLTCYNATELDYISNEDSLGRGDVSWSTWVIALT
jgi:SAM-dependent methyltransferase